MNVVLLNEVSGKQGPGALDLLVAEPTLCFHRVERGRSLAVHGLVDPDPARVLAPKVALGAVVAGWGQPRLQPVFHQLLLRYNPLDVLQAFSCDVVGRLGNVACCLAWFSLRTGNRNESLFEAKMQLINLGYLGKEADVSA